MWTNTSSRACTVITEISVRLFLLLLLSTLCKKYQPDKHYITEAELHPNYKRPIKESRVKMRTIMIVLIIMPLLAIFSPALVKSYDEALQGLLGWNLGLIMNAVVTEALKCAVCRPRPDFFYRCFPDSEITNDLHCTGDEAIVREGRKSFPSGHSSFACCSLGFLTLWLNCRLKSRRYGNITALLACVISMTMAGIICVTRVCDNRHHWQDVLGGSLLGLVLAYLSYNQYCGPLDILPVDIFTRNMYHDT